MLLMLATSAQAQEDAPPRPLPAEVQADVAAIAEHLSSVQEDAPPLACAKAVENARWGVETMLEVGEKNLRGGYMTQAAYDATTPTLKALLRVLTVQDCEAATGVRHDFYQCMSSDYNHVYACGKAHPFEP
ncbi:hypothetical protein ASD72_16960 [Pseudoxanthomonas sp. Root630]|nr:hypothetical protein ASD72_16960 [Pseudoxanthomonas sp. Root630]